MRLDERRCVAAHPEDLTNCIGAFDAVTIVDSRGTRAKGCEHHAARLLASLDQARVEPGSTPGGALRVFQAADTIRPFCWHTDAPRTKPGQLSHAEIRASATVLKVFPAFKPATEEDWSTEYLDAIISVAIVDGVAGAIAHINRYSSHHTEAIVSEDHTAVARFFNEIDSAILLHNASTQFADGGEFGMGAEIGIATGKMHARGPVGVEQLTSFKYRVHGTGQTRT